MEKKIINPMLVLGIVLLLSAVMSTVFVFLQRQELSVFTWGIVIFAGIEGLALIIIAKANSFWKVIVTNLHIFKTKNKPKSASKKKDNAKVDGHLLERKSLQTIGDKTERADSESRSKSNHKKTRNSKSEKKKSFRTSMEEIDDTLVSPKKQDLLLPFGNNFAIVQSTETKKDNSVAFESDIVVAPLIVQGDSKEIVSTVDQSNEMLVAQEGAPYTGDGNNDCLYECVNCSHNFFSLDLPFQCPSCKESKGFDLVYKCMVCKHQFPSPAYPEKCPSCNENDGFDIITK